MEINNNCKPIFIISHKYYIGFESYIEYYIQNIFKFYEDALVVVVDNNSNHKEEIFNKLKTYKNVILLENNITCKFELGAYKVGIRYLIDCELLEKYQYCIFTQDNFIIKNRLDFNQLRKNDINACQITSWNNDWEKSDVWVPVLRSIGLLDRLENSKLCWCNSFIVSTEKILKLYDYIKDITIITRHQSEAAERYIGRIIYELNEHKNYDIDGSIDSLDYYCHTVKIEDEVKSYFCKISQQKNELTRDKL
jgi:hypothetical protein